MKKLFLIITLCLFTMNAKADLAEDHFISVNPNSREGHRLAQAVDLAIEFIENAKDNIPQDFKVYVDRVIDKLSKSVFKRYDSSKIRTVALCQFWNASFFVSGSGYPNTIFICNRPWDALIKRDPIHINLFAQILTHEGIHLNNISDECIASRFEYHVMTNNNVGLVSLAAFKGNKRNCNGFKDLDLPPLE